jgi:hypothetical protein
MVMVLPHRRPGFFTSRLGKGMRGKSIVEGRCHWKHELNSNSVTIEGEIWGD